MSYMVIFLFLLLNGLVPDPATHGGDGSIHVTFIGLELIQGKLAIELLDEQERSVGDYWITVEGTSMVFDIPDLPEGRYAIRFFHDENNNGTLDRNWAGIPKEAFGFSNDAKVVFGPPSLESMLFQVNGRTEITVHSKRF